MTTTRPFLGFPDRLADGQVPRAVIFGAGHGSTYPGPDSAGYSLAADAIRAASQEDAAFIEHWDFDLGGPLFDGKPVSCIDAGDMRHLARPAHRAGITMAVAMHLVAPVDMGVDLQDPDRPLIRKASEEGKGHGTVSPEQDRYRR